MTSDRTDRAALRRFWPQWSLAAALLAALLWGALAPLRYPTHDKLLEIPSGTQARRMQGDVAGNLPAEVRLTLGVQDVLLLRNSDTVAQVFGPLMIMPGQDFRLPFEQAGEHRFGSSAHASGQVTVRVVPQPDPGWDRLRWRLKALVHAMRYLPLKGPDRP
jgi:hypothetical protein